MVSLSQPHRAAVYVNPYTREIMGRNKQFGFALHWTVMLLTAWAERLPALVCIRRLGNESMGLDLLRSCW